jgi:hypothetical protein
MLVDLLWIEHREGSCSGLDVAHELLHHVRHIDAHPNHGHMEGHRLAALDEYLVCRLMLVVRVDLCRGFFRALPDGGRRGSSFRWSWKQCYSCGGPISWAELIGILCGLCPNSVPWQQLPYGFPEGRHPLRDY